MFVGVAALGPSSAPAYYSEACPAILCATYGGDSREGDMIVSDDVILIKYTYLNL